MTHPDLDVEQRYLDALYARLDDEIEKATERLDEVRRRGVGGLHQARFEREAFAHHLEDRVATLRSHRRDDLCFGRIDLAGGERFYVGRIGLTGDEQEPLLIDWRAPASAPFYQATPADPLGVVRRRHFLTRGRRIVNIEDDVLDAGGISRQEAQGLRGEAALQYAMNTARTGRMQEIAATIQREQDQIIRAPMTPAVFVQGGPGTGKTAVALHRAAYLLYRYRHQLSAHDLLVIGPNPVFLRYIEHVLPSLGETGADLNSVADVYRRGGWQPEADAVRAVKAREVMVEVIERAIRTRGRPLSRPLDVLVEGERVRVTPADTRRVVAATRRRDGRHNDRALYAHDRLLKLLWRRAGRAVRDLWEFEDFRAEMLTDPRVRRLTQRVWPALTAEQLLNDLFGFPALLEQATAELRGAGRLDAGDVTALARPWAPRLEEARWGVADAALLDEAARQLGPVPADLDPAARRRRAEDDEARAEREYARERMAGLGGGMVSRQMLEERLGQPGGRDGGDDDEAGQAARRWRYAVVDEAQDLSPMEWRMIARHAPRRAATIVGDLAQGTSAWSARSWDAVRDALGAREEARVAELTINYRTPQEVAGFGARILEAAAPELRPPAAVREVPGSLRFEPAEVGGLVERVVQGAAELHREVADGVTCVVAPPSRVEEIHRRLAAHLGRAVPSPEDPEVLEAPVVVMAPAHAKGLEFDAVVLVEPGEIVEECGWRALYVSATRATQRLLVVHTGAEPLPA